MKRFKLLYSQLGNGMFVDKEKQFEDVIVDKEFQKIGLIKLVDLLNNLADENEQLKQSISDWRGSYDELYENVKNLEKENVQYQKELFVGSIILTRLMGELKNNGR